MQDGKRMLEKYDLFIFDWDGTLCEMHRLLRANEWLKRRLHIWNKPGNTSKIEADRKRLRSAVEIEQTKNRILTDIFEFASVLYKPRLHRDAVELIKLLRERGKKVAILSNGNSSRLAKELGSMGIRKYFDMVVSAKDIGAPKPNPAGIKMIIQKLKAKKERTIYLGDMIDDMLAADLAGVDSCALSDGFDSPAKLRSARPTYLLKSTEMLLEQMKGKRMAVR